MEPFFTEDSFMRYSVYPPLLDLIKETETKFLKQSCGGEKDLWIESNVPFLSAVEHHRQSASNSSAVTTNSASKKIKRGSHTTSRVESKQFKQQSPENNTVSNDGTDCIESSGAHKSADKYNTITVLQKPYVENDSSKNPAKMWQEILSPKKSGNVPREKVIPVPKKMPKKREEYLLPHIKYPHLSRLTKEEQKIYLVMYRKYIKGGAQPSSREEMKALHQFKELQSAVQAEREEFMKYLQEVAHIHKRDYVTIPAHVKRYMEQIIASRVKRVSNYPQFYVNHDTVAIAPPKKPAVVPFHHIKTLLNTGSVPVLNNTNNLRMAGLKLDYQQMKSALPTDNPDVQANKVVSEDPLCARLANDHNAHIVISSSALNCLINNHPPFTRQWEMPIEVRESIEETPNGYMRKKTVYIDKPFVSKEMTVREQFTWYAKLAMKVRLQCYKYAVQFKQDVNEPLVFVNNTDLLKQFNSNQSTDEQSDSALSTDDDNCDVIRADDIKSENTNSENNSVKQTKGSMKKNLKQKEPLRNKKKSLPPSDDVFAVNIEDLETFGSDYSRPKLSLISEAHANTDNEVRKNLLRQSTDKTKETTNPLSGRNVSEMSPMNAASNCTQRTSRDKNTQLKNLDTSLSDSDEEQLMIDSENEADTQLMDYFTQQQRGVSGADDKSVPQLDGQTDKKQTPRRSTRNRQSVESVAPQHGDVTTGIETSQPHDVTKRRSSRLSSDVCTVFDCDSNVNTEKNVSKLLKQSGQDSRQSSDVQNSMEDSSAILSYTEPKKRKRGRPPRSSYEQPRTLDEQPRTSNEQPRTSNEQPRSTRRSDRLSAANTVRPEDYIEINKDQSADKTERNEDQPEVYMEKDEDRLADKTEKNEDQSEVRTERNENQSAVKTEENEEQPEGDTARSRDESKVKNAGNGDEIKRDSAMNVDPPEFIAKETVELEVQAESEVTLSHLDQQAEYQVKECFGELSDELQSEEDNEPNMESDSDVDSLTSPRRRKSRRLSVSDDEEIETKRRKPAKAPKPPPKSKQATNWSIVKRDTDKKPAIKTKCLNPKASLLSAEVEVKPPVKRQPKVTRVPLPRKPKVVTSQIAAPYGVIVPDLLSAEIKQDTANSMQTNTETNASVVSNTEPVPVTANPGFVAKQQPVSLPIARTWTNQDEEKHEGTDPVAKARRKSHVTKHLTSHVADVSPMCQINCDVTPASPDKCDATHTPVSPSPVRKHEGALGDQPKIIPLEKEHLQLSNQTYVVEATSNTNSKGQEFSKPPVVKRQLRQSKKAAGVKSNKDFCDVLGNILGNTNIELPKRPQNDVSGQKFTDLGSKASVSDFTPFGQGHCNESEGDKRVEVPPIDTEIRTSQKVSAELQSRNVRTESTENEKSHEIPTKVGENQDSLHFYSAPPHLRDPHEWVMYETPQIDSQNNGNTPQTDQQNSISTADNIAGNQLQLVKRNVTYNLWQIGNQHVLIRCGYHGFKKDKFTQKAKFYQLAPKLEYQLEYGYEQKTLEEISRDWINMAIRHNCDVMRAHINGKKDTYDFVKFSTQDLMTLLQNTHNVFNPQASIHMLSGVFRKLHSLPAGRYLLSHAPSNARAHIKKTTQSRSGIYDLNLAYEENKLNNEFVPWVPVDPHVLVSFHERNDRIPCTFEPKDSPYAQASLQQKSKKKIQPNAKKGKKKKKGKGASK